MKYFTSEWWASGCRDESPFRRYSSYLESVGDHLPSKLIEFIGSQTLHDSRIRSVNASFTDDSLIFLLDGWDIEFTTKVSLKIEFQGVDCFLQQLPNSNSNDTELGDIGYYEFEWLDPHIEMRILFASGAEFTIRFLHFKYSFQVIN